MSFLLLLCVPIISKYTHTQTHLLGAGSTVENEEDRLIILALGLLLDVSLSLAKDLRRQLPEKQISSVSAMVHSCSRFERKLTFENEMLLIPTTSACCVTNTFMSQITNTFRSRSNLEVASLYTPHCIYISDYLYIYINTHYVNIYLDVARLVGTVHVAEGGGDRVPVRNAFTR